jgi:MEDS: MEthanogen/methylotroph, DcmR Sensory domain
MNLYAGEHGEIFYTSKEEMRDIHFAFVKSGLENNWPVIYSAPGSHSEELRNALQDYGIAFLKISPKDETRASNLQDRILDVLTGFIQNNIR